MQKERHDMRTVDMTSPDNGKRYGIVFPEFTFHEEIPVGTRSLGVQFFGGDCKSSNAGAFSLSNLMLSGQGVNKTFKVSDIFNSVDFGGLALENNLSYVKELIADNGLEDEIYVNDVIAMVDISLSSREYPVMSLEEKWNGGDVITFSATAEYAIRGMDSNVRYEFTKEITGPVTMKVKNEGAVRLNGYQDSVLDARIAGELVRIARRLVAGE